MKAVFAVLVLVGFAQFANAEGGELNPVIYNQDGSLVSQTHGPTPAFPKAETPEERNEREALERNPWINPAILAKQSKGMPIDRSAGAEQYCGSYFKTVKQAAKYAPATADLRIIRGVGVLVDCSYSRGN